MLRAPCAPPQVLMLRDNENERSTVDKLTE